MLWVIGRFQIESSAGMMIAYDLYRIESLGHKGEKENGHGSTTDKSS
jgi:hypothetical protein